MIIMVLGIVLFIACGISCFIRVKRKNKKAIIFTAITCSITLLITGLSIWGMNKIREYDYLDYTKRFREEYYLSPVYDNKFLVVDEINDKVHFKFKEAWNLPANVRTNIYTVDLNDANYQEEYRRQEEIGWVHIIITKQRNYFQDKHPILYHLLTNKFYLEDEIEYDFYVTEFDRVCAFDKYSK